MHHKTRILLQELCVFLLFFVMCINSANAIYVYRYEQERDTWCWAASAQMIGHTLGRTVTQSQIVEYVKGSVCDGGADIFQASQAVDYATLQYSTVHGKFLTFSDVIAELSSGDPFYVSIGWNSGSGGHAVVASGYSSTSRTVTLIDPWYDAETAAYPYDSMISSCTFQTGTGYWRNTITV